MTRQKQKAFELIEKFKKCKINLDYYDLRTIGYICAKECALIAVDEIILLRRGYCNKKDFSIQNDDWWQEVKQEIKKL